MKYAITFCFIILANTYFAQEFQNKKLVGGNCEGCEAVFEFGSKKLSPVDTLVGVFEKGKKIKISGTVFKPGGRIPAEDVIIYIYQADQSGIYPKKGGEKGWAKRHGNIRGWVKTDSEGKYSFYSIKPGTYPSRTEPAHIHLTILEPDGKYYWIDPILFSDDPLIKESKNIKTKIRGGGSPAITLREDVNLLIGKRNIVLGENIPGYNPD